MTNIIILSLFCALVCNAYSSDVHHSPSIITEPNDQTVVTGSVASFVCRVSGNPKPQIEWRKNGKRLSSQSNVLSVVDTPNGSVLRIESVKPNRDNDTYECLAENGVREAVRALAVLNVLSEQHIPNGFPRITLQPYFQGVERGWYALIPCKAEGDPEPHISWLKDMVPIDMSNTRYSLYQSSSLHINAVQEKDEGHYECVADNNIGSAYSYLATLYVRTRVVLPYFSITPKASYEVMPGSSLNLTCVAIGTPMPVVSWKMGRNELSPIAVPIGTNVLKLENIRESNNYTCVAHTKPENIESFTQVIVRSLPRAPTNVSISDITPTSVRLSWSYDIGAEFIVYFVVRYKPKNSSEELSEISGITTFFYMIGSLTPNTEYEFYCLAVNAIGRGTHSTAVYAMTHSGIRWKEREKTARDVQARALTSSTIIVKWKHPEEPGGQVIGYKVYYTAQPTLPTSLWTIQTVDSYPLTTISDLQTNMIYTIRVQVFTYRSTGPLSDAVRVKTQEGVPSEPLNLRAVAMSSTTVQLNWQKPDYEGVGIIGYELYWNDTFANQESRRSIPDVQSFTLTDLL